MGTVVRQVRKGIGMVEIGERTSSLRLPVETQFPFPHPRTHPLKLSFLFPKNTWVYFPGKILTFHFPRQCARLRSAALTAMSLTLTLGYLLSLATLV